MYEYIQGILIKCCDQTAIIDVGGIGYKVQIPCKLVNQMPLVSHKIFLYVSWVVKPESQTLYGFFLEAERELFETLISLSGIGPKTALNIIGYLEIDELWSIIQKEDPTLLVKIPGIGKKTAERLLIDLRGTLPAPSHISPRMSIANDGVKALMNLGYTQSKAEKAIQTALKKSDEKDLTALITLALKSG